MDGEKEFFNRLYPNTRSGIRLMYKDMIKVGARAAAGESTATYSAKVMDELQKLNFEVLLANP